MTNEIVRKAARAMARERLAGPSCYEVVFETAPAPGDGVTSCAWCGQGIGPRVRHAFEGRRVCSARCADAVIGRRMRIRLAANDALDYRPTSFYKFAAPLGGCAA